MSRAALYDSIATATSILNDPGEEVRVVSTSTAVE